MADQAGRTFISTGPDSGLGFEPGPWQARRRGSLMTRAIPRQPGRFPELPAEGTGSRRVRRPARPAAYPASVSQAAPLWAVVSAGLSPVLATGGWLVADALQPASYSPLRKTISVLAGYGGTDRWVMTGALFLVGGCDLVAAAGLSGVRASARVLLVIAGMASIGIAASPEPAVGSTPQHLAWTALGAVAIAVFPAFTARASPRPRILNRNGSAAVTAVFLALLAWLVAETQGGSVLGLAERLTTSVQASWPFIVALALRRSTPRPRACTPPRPARSAADWTRYR